MLQRKKARFVKINVRFINAKDEIKNKIRKGFSLKEIHQELKEKVSVSYPQFCRLVKKEFSQKSLSPKKRTLDIFIEKIDEINRLLKMGYSKKAVWEKTGFDAYISYVQFLRLMEKLSENLQLPSRLKETDTKKRVQPKLEKLTETNNIFTHNPEPDENW